MSGYQELNSDQSNVQGVKARSGTRRKRRKRTLTQERVRELFNYNPETGDLTRKLDIKNGKNYNIVICKINDIAGSRHTRGYREVRIDNESYLVHRVIWLWMEGYLPEGDIDHINQIKSDNRWCNLRLVSRSCNMFNVGNNTTNTSGVRGVSLFKRKKNKWEVYITVDGVRAKLGYFSDFTEAVAHRLGAEQCVGRCNENTSAAIYMRRYLSGE